MERLGVLTLLQVVLPGGEPVTVQSDGGDATRARQPVHLAVDAAACHLFDAQGQAFARLARHPLAA